jgi:hypothetical protein
MNTNTKSSTNTANAMASAGVAMMGGLMGSVYVQYSIAFPFKPAQDKPFCFIDPFLWFHKPPIYRSDKWNNSGGNQVLDRFSATIPEGTKQYLSQTSAALFSREKLRSMVVFFGMGEEKPFYLESAPSLFVARLKHNMSFFYLNYFVITATLFVLTLLISPSAIIGIGLLAAAWFVLIRSTQNGYLTIKGISISQKNATIAMTVISVLVLFRLLSYVFWLSLASSGFLCGLHAFFRDASMHKDESDKIVMTGDMVGEESAFLTTNINSV